MIENKCLHLLLVRSIPQDTQHRSFHGTLFHSHHNNIDSIPPTSGGLASESALFGTRVCERQGAGEVCSRHILLVSYPLCSQLIVLEIANKSIY